MLLEEKRILELKACNDAFPVSGVKPAGLADEFTVSVFFHIYFNMFINVCHHSFRVDNITAAVAGGHILNFKNATF